MQYLVLKVNKHFTYYLQSIIIIIKYRAMINEITINNYSVQNKPFMASKTTKTVKKRKLPRPVCMHVQNKYNF